MRSESLAVLCKRLQQGVGIVYENLVKSIGIMQQSCKERKKNWEMVCRHAEWPKVADAVIEADRGVLDIDVFSPSVINANTTSVCK
jgi:hypothetical protein